MSPALRRLLFGLFMSFPGVLLAVAGFLAAAFSAVALSSQRDVPGVLPFVGCVLASAIVSGLGSCMVAFADMQEGADSPRRREQPRVIFTRIGMMVMALLCGCTAIVAINYLNHGKWLPALAAVITGGLLFLLIVVLQSARGLPGEGKGP